MHRFSDSIRSFMVGLLLPVLLALPQVLVSSHIPVAFDQAQSERHALLGAGATEDASHTHDHGAPEEQRPNHLHGHNLADHAHESAHPVYQGLPPVVNLQIWHPGHRCACFPPYRIPPERPPRAAAAV